MSNKNSNISRSSQAFNNSFCHDPNLEAKICYATNQENNQQDMDELLKMMANFSINPAHSIDPVEAEKSTGILEKIFYRIQELTVNGEN